MAAKSVYRCLLQTLRRYTQHSLPATGVLNMASMHCVMDPWFEAAAAFRSQDSLADGLASFRSLVQQKSLLLTAEEEPSLAMQQWGQLQQRWGDQPVQQWSWSSSMAAVEEGSLLVYQLHTDQTMAQLLLEEDVEEQQQTVQATLEQAAATLDGIAAAVHQAVPSTSSTVARQWRPCTHQQLAALTHAVFQEHRFRCEPVEWVYDGLSPLLLPELLQRRKGLPLSLALLLVAVGRRLGMPLLLVCARDAPALGTASGLPHLQNLPPEVATRQAARSLAAPPAPNTWLVAAATQQTPTATSSSSRGEHSSSTRPEASDSSSSSSSSKAESPAAGVMFIDPSHKGELLDAAAALARYPNLAEALPQLEAALAAPLSTTSDDSAYMSPPASDGQQAAGAAVPSSSVDSTSSSSSSSRGILQVLQRLPSRHALQDPAAQQQQQAARQLQALVLTVWGELARTMVTAHQRRGESDAVAAWLYQLLALDTHSPEWQQFAQAS